MAVREMNAKLIPLIALDDFQLVVFGSENNDVLTGQGKVDRIYRGDGDKDRPANDAMWKEVA